MQASVSHEVAFETLQAYQKFGTEVKAAEALGISRSTFAHRRRRAIQILGSDVTHTLLNEQKFSELHIDDGIVLVCSDVHCWPGPFTVAQRAFIWFASQIKPTAVVINGDLFDGTGLSRFPASNWNQKPSVKQELDACKDFTSALAAASPGSKKFFVPGNHDERFNRRLIEGVPEYAGVPGFNLYDAFPEWTVAYRLTVNPEGAGMTDLVHNWAGGIHAAYNNVLRSGINYVTGHTHRNLVRPWMDRSGIRYGIETGTLTGIDHPSTYYTGGRPVDWHPGFIVLTFADGLLMRPEHVDVLDEERVAHRGVIATPPEFN